MILELLIGPTELERSFTIESDPGRSLLDILETLRSTRDSSLRYRHSCHHGSCGTCGALVDGVPKLLCVTRAGDLTPGFHRIEALSHMTLIGDLAVYPGPLFDTLPDTGYLRREKESERLEDCIECGICAEACPVTAPFKGPAALAAMESEISSRPGRTADMLALAGAADGTAACERKFECSRVCPRGVAPGKRITSLIKRLAPPLPRTE